MRITSAFVLSLVFCLGLLGTEITLESASFTPDPGTAVTIVVHGAPAGATFRWDLDGDGIYERTSGEPQALLTAATGLRVVRVEVIQGNTVLKRIVAGIVADPTLGATRTLVPEDGALLVTITVVAKVPVIAPGFVEDVPTGFALDVVAEGGAFWRKVEKLEAVWPVILDPGQTLSFTYRLYPLAGVDFQFSGMVSAYFQGKRVEIPIAGILHP